MTLVNFCSMPFLSTDFSNVIDFENKESRDNYFISNTLESVEVNIKYDNSREYININFPVEKSRKYDYLWYEDKQGNKYFYFITNIEMKTTTNCNLHLKLDTWTTYLFDFKIMPSFVDRCHVPRWVGDIPSSNNENEELEKGEIIQIEEPTEISTLGKSIVITTSVPIGYLKKGGSGNDGSGGSGGNITGELWQNGQISSQCFRFIKGMEAFAPRPYKDPGGYWTIGYGVSKVGQPSVYADLESKAPISEELASQTSYKLKNESYGKPILNAVKSFGCNKQYQFDALASLAYNAGVGSVTGDNSLTRALKQGIDDEARIRAVWEKFKITSNGITLEGLKVLRKNQCNMFFNKSFEIRPIPIVTASGGLSGTVKENDGNGWLP